MVGYYRVLFLVFLMIGLTASMTVARAEGCILKRVASFEVKGLERERVLIPVGVGNQRYYFVVDTGTPYSVLSRWIIDDQGLLKRKIPGAVYNIRGTSFTEIARVATFELGGMTGGPFWFMAEIEQPGIQPSAPSIVGAPGPIIPAGLLGADFLSVWDVELDLAEKKLNFFSQDHCPGNVVYWSPDYVQIPMDLDEGHHIGLPVKIDGKEIMSIIDTGAPYSLLNLSSAEYLFDVGADSDGVKKIGEYNYGSLTPTPEYQRQFKTLQIGDVTFGNPVIHLMEMRSPAVTTAEMAQPRFRPGLPHFLVGLHQLRLLRVYIAYKERMLYVTVATKPVAALN